MGGYDHMDSELSNLPPEAFEPFEGPFEPVDFWLKNAPKDEQQIAMREWFLARYCSPAKETNYNGRKGGFQFIHGGPYDPENELFKRFSGIVDDNIIQGMVDEFHSECGDEWAPVQISPPNDFEYDDRYSLDFQSHDDPLRKLKERLDHAQRVLGLSGDFNAEILARNLVFGAAISALEAFLWETVDYWVEHDDKALREIVTSIPALREQPLKLGDIFTRHAGLKEHVKGYLQNMVWHRWEQVAPLFKLGLGLQLPSLKQFDDALLKRHHIVHRSGHDKEGNRVYATIDEIMALCVAITTFATEIDAQLGGRDQVVEDPNRLDR